MRWIFPFVLLLSICVAGSGQPLPPGSPALVITEILYDMPGAADSLEFIELTNPSDTNERSLSEYSFTEGIEFTFPQGLIIQPAEVIVVARDADAMMHMFGVEAYQWDSGELSNDGELVVLSNNFNQAIDSVNYQVDLLWPEASGNGKSIVFCNDTLNNLGPIHWSAATTNTGVTVDGVTIFANPGTNCTDWVGLEENVEETIQVYPNPNSGQFRIEFPSQAKGNALISIVDMNGSVVFRQALHRAHSGVEFDSNLSDGVYLVSIETESAIFHQRLVIVE